MASPDPRTPSRPTRPPAPRNAIGDRVRQARLRLRPPVSQVDLVARLELQGFTLTQSAVSKLESRQRHLTDLEIIALAKSLRTSVGYLFGETDRPEPATGR